jgi:hypothetical protein
MGTAVEAPNAPAGVSTFSSTASPAAFARDATAAHARVSAVQEFDTYRARSSRSDSLWSVEPSFEQSGNIARCITGRLQQPKLSAFEQTYFSVPQPSIMKRLVATPGVVALMSALLLLSIMLCRHRRKQPLKTAPSASASSARSTAM